MTVGPSLPSRRRERPGPRDGGRYTRSGVEPLEGPWPSGDGSSVRPPRRRSRGGAQRCADPTDPWDLPTASRTAPRIRRTPVPAAAVLRRPPTRTVMLPAARAHREVREYRGADRWARAMAHGTPLRPGRGRVCSCLVPLTPVSGRPPSVPPRSAGQHRWRSCPPPTVYVIVKLWAMPSTRWGAPVVVSVMKQSAR